MIQKADIEVELTATDGTGNVFRRHCSQTELQRGILSCQRLNQLQGAETGERHRTNTKLAIHPGVTHPGLCLQPVIRIERYLRPGKNTLTFRCETFEALTPANQRQAKFLFQSPNTHGQCRLCDVAENRRQSEMTGLVKRDKVLQLFNVHPAPELVVMPASKP